MVQLFYLHKGMMLFVKGFLGLSLIGYVVSFRLDEDLLLIQIYLQFCALSLKRVVIDVNPLALINHETTFKNVDDFILLNYTIEFLMDFKKIIVRNYGNIMKRYLSSIFRQYVNFQRHLMITLMIILIRLIN